MKKLGSKMAGTYYMSKKWVRYDYIHKIPGKLYKSLDVPVASRKGPQ
jgi:hypothetical protein